MLLQKSTNGMMKPTIPTPAPCSLHVFRQLERLQASTACSAAQLKHLQGELGERDASVTQLQVEVDAMRKRLHVLQVRDGQTWHPNYGQILCGGLQTSIRPACRGSRVRGLSCGCSSTSVRLHLCGCRSPRPRRPPRTSSHWLHQTPPCRQTWHRQGAQGGRRVDVTSAGTPAAHAWMPAEEEFREADTCEVNTSGSQCLETRLAWFRNSPDLLPCAVKRENCSSFLAQALALDHARNHLRSELVWTKAKLAFVSHMAGQLRAKLHAAEAERAHAGGWPAPCGTQGFAMPLSSRAVYCSWPARASARPFRAFLVSAQAEVESVCVEAHYLERGLLEQRAFAAALEATFVQVSARRTGMGTQLTRSDEAGHRVELHVCCPPCSCFETRPQGVLFPGSPPCHAGQARTDNGSFHVVGAAAAAGGACSSPAPEAGGAGRRVGSHAGHLGASLPGAAGRGEH